MNQANLMQSLSGLKVKGLGAPILLMAMMAMMILPLPPFLLDVLFTFNIVLALVVLLVSVYAKRTLDFTLFPSVLLIATLLRLSLNVASTRVVLLRGHEGGDAAGKVIAAFGEVVIGGNYAVGFIIFIILMIINFVVVTKGAGRISEVSARFTLDAMPGKQMAVDADLNAGLISQEEAKERRSDVSREADFYGSMDGASKFVRGDAIAGILILLINLVGGFGIGMVQHGLDFATAGEYYAMLTIGDGLVAQIPSLLLSTAAAMMVTRVSGDVDMGEQLKTEMFADPKALSVAAIIVAIMGIVPGMPHFAFLSLAGLCGLLAWYFAKQAKQIAEGGGQALALANQPAGSVMAVGKPASGTLVPTGDAAPVAEISWDDVANVDLIGLEVGYRLIPLVDANQGGELMTRIKGVRKKLSQELGFLIPPVHIRDNLDLPPSGYRITLLGVNIGEAEIQTNAEMAINPGQVFGDVKGTPTIDPAFGLQAFWIDPNTRNEAQTLGYTVVDPGTVVATHMSHLIQTHAHELLGHEEVQQLLNLLGKQSPKLVESLTPNPLPLSVLVKVLQGLLEEQIPIRDMRSICEALAELAPRSQDPDTLLDRARVSLRRMIVQGINGLEHELPVITLDPGLEHILQQSLQAGAQGGFEPGLVEKMQQSIQEAAQRQEMSGQPAVLLVAPGLRRTLSRFLKGVAPGLNVLSYQEIPDNRNIKVVASVGQ
ncbi:flagellar biosynthesis protein FlhA [Pelagibaculum spongiae]|uniref:Flagellar biosynthesis protein FlhA n=1 Tax=Pelagibaculum spongiae TaxID=2080658 RepID=A0A2V1GXN4_9GAMM|nr:flagellar biosynthesis protein FlhA [Pelagibaculum spongiae]PVZ66696.1 flagellar biosynthesis protein FlhA [Pelagibaculum spongiae]